MIELLKNWPKGDPVPALSLRQPWATAVAFYGKDIENRSRNFKYRGPLIIHASRTPPYIDDFYEFLRLAELDGLPADAADDLRADLDQKQVPEIFLFGSLAAMVNLVDCVPSDNVPEDHPAKESPWGFKGANWLYLEDATPVMPVDYKGAVGIFKVPYETAASLKPVPRINS